MNIDDTANDRWQRELEMRHRLFHKVKVHLNDPVVHTATDAFGELLADAGGDMAEELLMPIFNWSDFWPKRIAAEILGLPTDDDHEWEELLEGFEALERQNRPKQSEQPDWLREGF